MKKYFILILCTLLFNCVVGQNTFKAHIINGGTGQPLKGATATLADLKFTTSADSSGLITIPNIPNGKFEVAITYVGFNTSAQIYNFPLQRTNGTLEITLEPQQAELAEITIQTTRTNQNLRDIPTRIEALPAEELDEKTTMRPGDIKMLLGESTGIHVQATSATSGSASFRIQGLDSRYTQLLQDGMPLYNGFSGGLSLLQVSPLNLKQVEFIKGSASTLYGGGAIAGLVNLISKTPQTTPELTVLLNQTTAKGSDASAYYGQKWQHVGTTVYAAYNYNGAYDPSDIGLSAIPQTNRVTFNPKLFLYFDNKNTACFGINTTFENRFGGDMQVIDGHADNTHQYFERNKTSRVSTQLSYTRKINQESQINIKNTVGYFNRALSQPGFTFAGKQLSSYSEINYVKSGERANWVAGANLITDNFNADAPQNNLNYNLTTAGVFAQNTFKAAEWFWLESGLRLDATTPAPANPANGLFILPRINALFKFSKQITSRVGGGLGYKMPTLFNDDSEQDGYQNIKPINLGSTQAERSYGVNADINYRGKLTDDIVINVNQLFFYTEVNNPLVLQSNSFVNAPGYLSTQGAETNIKLVADELAFYLGYTYTDANRHFNGLSTAQTLTPQHQLNLDFTYEIENSLRLGAESYYTSRQLLVDGTTGRGYITFGLLIQKMWKHFDVYINAEDLTDRRQTRWDSIYTGSITNPKFKDIYAPLDGAVINMVLRIKLLK